MYSRPPAACVFTAFRTAGHRSCRIKREAQIDQVKFLGKNFRNRIFYTAKTFEFVGRNPAYMLWDPETGRSEKAAFPDAMITNTVGTDSAYGGGALLCVCEEGLYFCNTGRHSSEIFLLPPDGGSAPDHVLGRGHPFL